MTKTANGTVIDMIKDVIDIQRRVDRSPYATVAGALGVGFVLGGGLFTRLTEKIAGAALRAGLMAALPRIKQELGWFTGRNAKTAGSPTGSPCEKGD